MMRRLVGALLVALAVPAAAQNSPVIVAAKAAGQVGERYDGFIGYAAAPSGALRNQVEAVNIRRRSLYTGLASRTGKSRVDVGIVAGCETLATVAVGQAYLLGDNVWRRRGAGDAVPIPDYCRR